MKKRCIACGDSFRGRSDKKFCSAYCRSSYHNRIYAREAREMRRVNSILRHNRRLLLTHLSREEPVVDLFTLLQEGFCPEYCTGYIPLENGRGQFLCYEVCYEWDEVEQTIRLTQAAAAALF